jgi:hypothetical protein
VSETTESLAIPEEGRVENLAHAFVREQGKDVEAERADWHGDFLEWTDDFGSWLETRGIAYRLLWMESVEGHESGDHRRGTIFPSPLLYPGERWSSHTALEIDGRVHDLWFIDEALPVADYLAKMFPGQVVVCEYPAEEEL